MENTTWSWAKKGIAALFAVLIASCCMFLAGCAENSEEAVRNAVSEEFNEIKDYDTETIEEIAGNTAEFQALGTYGISATDAYEAVFNGFDYQIESVKVDGDKATVGVKFTSKDFSQFQSALTAAAQQAATDGSLTGMDSQQLNNAIGQLVLKTIKDLPTTETDVIDFDCVKQGGKWELASNSGDKLQAALFPTSVMTGSSY